MEERSELSVVIDGKVYRLSGGSDIYLQKLASCVHFTQITWQQVLLLMV